MPDDFELYKLLLQSSLSCFDAKRTVQWDEQDRVSTGCLQCPAPLLRRCRARSPVCPREGNKCNMTNQCSFPDILHCFHVLFSRAEPSISSSNTIYASHQIAFRHRCVCWFQMLETVPDKKCCPFLPRSLRPIIQFISEQGHFRHWQIAVLKYKFWSVRHQPICHAKQASQVNRDLREQSLKVPSSGMAWRGARWKACLGFSTCEMTLLLKVPYKRSITVWY